MTARLMRSSNTKLTMAGLWRRKRLHASCRWLRLWVVGSATASSGGIGARGGASTAAASMRPGAAGRSGTPLWRSSRIADPRVQERVQDVRDEVEQDHERYRDHQPRQDDHVIAGVHRVDEEAPHPGPGEDRFGDDETARDRSHVEGHLRRDRDQRVAHRVPNDDATLAEPLRASRTEEVALEHLQHARAHVAAVHRDDLDRHHENRQEEMPETVE